MATNEVPKSASNLIQVAAALRAGLATAGYLAPGWLGRQLGVPPENNPQASYVQRV